MTAGSTQKHESYGVGTRQRDLGNTEKKEVGVAGGLGVRNENKKGFKTVSKVFFPYLSINLCKSGISLEIFIYK